MKTIVILGTGGHARMVASVVLDMMDAGEAVAIAGYTTNGKPDRPPLGGAVLGDDSVLPELARAGTATHFVLGLGSVRGGQALRPELFAAARAAGLTPATLAHRTATIMPGARLGAGTVLMPHAVIGAEAVLGENVIVNTKASVDHDGRVGDHAHISVGATLSGTVSVGANSLVGAGATVSHGVEIGNDVTVGAGAVVVRAVGDGLVVAGVPARALGT